MPCHWHAWVLAVSLAAAWGAPARAQSFSVSAEIVAGCAIRGTSQTTGLVFGTLDFGVRAATDARPAYASAPAGSIGGLSLDCTPGLTLTIAVDGGLHASGGTRRLMSAGGAVVPYALYADAGLQTPIPSHGGLGIVVPPGGALDVPIHAVAQPAGAGQAPGTYADTLAVTFSW